MANSQKGLIMKFNFVGLFLVFFCGCDVLEFKKRPNESEPMLEKVLCPLDESLRYLPAQECITSLSDELDQMRLRLLLVPVPSPSLSVQMPNLFQQPLLEDSVRAQVNRAPPQCQTFVNVDCHCPESPPPAVLPPSAALPATKPSPPLIRSVQGRVITYTNPTPEE